ncbi:hydroxypyruvate isomerase [Zoogloea oryzae]|uniref:Hydroxypyruvate isomerase n=1 Tax=Zoogloea oryzae TaxID=310767 RepID=A0ABQ6F528_9RHOO|nr:hydroxypyruvate isomerase [Zoogloea oryzae]GLT20653.1 hydroxypyruvate isomerase [Zoogloea oryzae]
MLRFSANLSFLFLDRPFLDRFAAAAANGFKAVEFHFPYAFPVDEVVDAAHRAAVEVVLFNFPAGDWAAGERGIACLPDRVAEFREGVELAARYAEALACPRVNCLAGRRPDGVDEALLCATLVDNLRHAADAFAPAGRQVLMEPLNTRDTPGFLIDRTAPALAVLDAADRPNQGLQYDIYHAQVMEGDLARTLESALPRIGHIQLADNPGRHQPGTGEINFPFLFRHLKAIGYEGWIGCEYVPTGPTEDSFEWMV